MNRNARIVTWAAAISVLGAAAVVLFLFDPARVSIYPVCLFHRATGLDCPGCGGLRAVHQLLHGEWKAAFRLNPLFVLLIPVMLALSARALWLRRRCERAEFVRASWMWVFCIAMILFGVLRNLGS
jgi:hypothetical protein